MSRYPQLADADWLTKRYVDEGLSLRRIAARVGCGPSTVKRALRRHQVPARPARPPGIRTGDRFGRLVVLGRAAERTRGGRRHFVCLCGCGTERTVDGSSLRSGCTRSCGCLSRELSAGRLATHGHTSGGKSRTYRSWQAMIDRCTRPAHVGWNRYGGAGVTVCERWLDFALFLEDMGERPPGTELGRYGDEGHYEPGNVAWMTRAEQGGEARKKRAARR